MRQLEKKITAEIVYKGLLIATILFIFGRAVQYYFHG